MRLNPRQIRTLQCLLKSKSGLDYSDEEVQLAGIAIMRFVVAKHCRKEQQLMTKQGVKQVKNNSPTNNHARNLR